MPKSALRKASVVLAAAISGISLFVSGCGNPTEQADSALITKIETADTARANAKTTADLNAIQATYDQAASDRSVSAPMALIARSRQAQLRYQQTLDLMAQLRDKEIAIRRTIGQINQLGSQLAGSQSYVVSLKAYDPSAQINAIKSKQADIGGDASKPEWTLAAPTPDDATAALKFPTLAKLSSFIDATTAAIAKNKSDIADLQKQSADAVDQAETLTRKSESETGKPLLDDQTKASELRKNAAVADAQVETLTAQQARLQADLDTATAQKTATEGTNQSLDVQAASRQASWKAIQDEMAAQQTVQKQLVAGASDTSAANARPSIKQRAAELSALLLDASALRDKIDSELNATITQFNQASKDASTLRGELIHKIQLQPQDADKPIWDDEMETLNPGYFTLGEAAATASKAEVAANKTAIDSMLEQMFDGTSVKAGDTKAPLQDAKANVEAPATDITLPGLTALLDQEKTGLETPKEVSDLPKLTKDQIAEEVTSVNEKFQKALDVYNTHAAATDSGPAAKDRINAGLMGRAMTLRQWAQFELMLGLPGADAHINSAIEAETSATPPKPEVPAMPATPEAAPAAPTPTTPTTPAAPAATDTGTPAGTPTTPAGTPTAPAGTPAAPDAGTPPATPAPADNGMTPAPATQPAPQ